MDVRRIVVLLLLAAGWFPTIAWPEEMPDAAVIGKWLQTDEEFTIDTILPVTLVKGEPAYLVNTYFPERGLCCNDGTILARPERAEAREIDVVSQTLTLLDLDRDGVSEIEGQGSAMGQGWVEGIWQIYRLDDWEPIILYEYGPLALSNAGAGCGLREHEFFDRACEERTVTLSYEDVNQDGVLDLVQAVTEDIFWFKAGIDEDAIFSDETARQQAIDPESRRLTTSQQTYLYAQQSFTEVQEP